MDGAVHGLDTLSNRINTLKSACRLEYRIPRSIEGSGRKGRFRVLIRINSGQGSSVMNTLDLRCLMAQPNSSIGNVTTNTGLVEMAMAYSPQPRALCGGTSRHLPMRSET